MMMKILQIAQIHLGSQADCTRTFPRWTGYKSRSIEGNWNEKIVPHSER